MDFAFNYTAKSMKGASVSGVIFSDSVDDAYYQVHAVLKLTPVEIRFNFFQSVVGLFQRRPPARDLIRFYRTLAERKRIGRSIPQGLQDAMEYVDNQRFVSSLAIMRQSMFDGMKFSDAMEMAGFPMTDVQAVRSVQLAGKEAEILAGLADQMEMNEDIKRKISSIVWYPIVVALTAWIVAWWMLVYIAPKLGEFFKKVSALDLSLPVWARRYYEFADWFGAHTVIGTAIWIAIPVGAFLICRSRWMHAILDHVPAFYNLSMKADLIAIWSSVGLLHVAGVKPVEVFASIAASARRPDNVHRLEEMASVYRAGNHSIGTAVGQCNFPKYVVAEISAAESANNWSDGFANLVAILRQDVARHIEQTQRIAMLISYAVITIFLVAFFLITLYPQISATMSKL